MRQQRYYNIQPTLKQHPYANSDIVPSIFNQHCTNVVMPTLYQHSANIGPTSMRQQRYYNIQPTMGQCYIIPMLYIPTFSQHWTNIHAPTAILQYSANIGPTSMRQQRYYNIQPTMGQCHYTNAIYSNIQPTLDQHPCANSDITIFSQHWTNIPTPTAILCLQHLTNIAPMSLCHRYTNIRPTLDQHPCANSDITIFSQHWTNIPTPTAILCLQHLTNIEPMSLCQRYTNIRPTLDQHPCANSDITIFSQHWTNIHAPTAILQYSANIGPTSMRQQRYSNIQPTLDQHPCANSDITIFSQHWTNIPTPTAILCLQHLTNIAPMSLCQRYTNIRPTLDQHPCANSDITIFSQHWTNIPTPTAILCLQHLTNIEPMSLCQRYTNIRPTLDQHPCANSDITIFSQHWTNIHAPTAILQYSANIGPTSMRQQRYYNIQPTMGQCHYTNAIYIPTFSQHWTNIHAPTAILQYSANIGPTSMRQQRYYNIQPTMGQCHYTNAIYSNIQPTLGQHTCANSDITTYLANTGPASMRQQRYYNLFSQHWAIIVVPTATFSQRWANSIAPTAMLQPSANIGPTSLCLLGSDK